MRGCTSCGWVMDVAIVAGIICFGLLTLVLLLANSNRMVWGRSGSNRTPCCKHNWNRKGGWCWVKRCFGDARTHQNIHIFGFQCMCLLLACDLKSLSGGEDKAAALHLSLPFKAILISPILLKFETIAFLPGQWNRTMTSFCPFLYSSLLTIYTIAYLIRFLCLPLFQ